MNVCSLCITGANRVVDSELTVMISNSELHFIYIYIYTHSLATINKYLKKQLLIHVYFHKMLFNLRL